MTENAENATVDGERSTPRPEIVVPKLPPPADAFGHGEHFALVVDGSRVTLAAIASESSGFRVAALATAAWGRTDESRALPALGEPAEVQTIPGAIDVCLGSIHRRVRRVSVLVGGRLVRELLDYLPPTPKSLTALAVRRMVQATPGETVSYIALDQVRAEAGTKKVCTLGFAVATDVLMQIIDSLESRHIAIDRLLPLTSVLPSIGLPSVRAASPRGTTLSIDVTPERIVQSFVSHGRLLFFRQSELRLESGLEDRAIGEVQRTSVFFHRRFAPHSVDLILLTGSVGTDVSHIASSIAAVIGIPTARVPSPLLSAEGEPARAEAGLLLAMGAAVAPRRDPFLRSADLTPEPIKRAGHRRVAAWVAGVFAVAILMSGIAWRGAVEGRLGAQRRDLLGLESAVIEARETMHALSVLQEERAAIASGLDTVDLTIGQAPAFSEFLAHLGRDLPTGVALTHLSMVQRQESPQSSVWKAVLSFSAQRSYFAADSAIRATRAVVGNLPGVSGESIADVVANGSKPYRGNDASEMKGKAAAGETTEFALYFEVRGP